MAQQLKVKVQSTIISGEDRESYTLVSRGRLRDTHEGISLTYEEGEGDSKSGYSTLTLLPGGEIKWHRVGAVKTDLTFAPGQRCEGKYQVPPFSFSIAVIPTQVEWSLGERGGEVSLGYTRELEGDIARVTFRLWAEPEEEKQ